MGITRVDAIFGFRSESTTVGFGMTTDSKLPLRREKVCAWIVIISGLGLSSGTHVLDDIWDARFLK